MSETFSADLSADGPTVLPSDVPAAAPKRSRTSSGTRPRKGGTPVTETARRIPETPQEWAEWCARRGWYVLPLVRGEKKPAVSKPWERATRESPTITKWFGGTRPRYDVGIACGRSDLLVVDEDQADALAKFAADHGFGQPPRTFTVESRPGHRHLYFRVPDGARFTNSAGPLKSFGIDIRSDGGLVPAPGATHKSGSIYTPLDLGVPVEVMPDWLVEVLSPPPSQTSETDRRATPGLASPRYAESALNDETRRVRDAQEGNRNETLNQAAFNLGQLVAGGPLAQAEVESALLDAALVAGLDGPSSRRTIKSGLDAGRSRPRSGPSVVVDGGAWQALDLAAWFENPPPPAERFGSGQMLYRGALHWLAGEPESGKSILMLHWALEEMRRGHNVVILDEEAGPRDVFAKLQALGATPQVLASHLTYLPPAGRNLLTEAARLREVVAQTGATFVGVDGAAAHLAIADLNEDSASDVTRFVVKGLLPLAHQQEASLVVLDHMTKSGTNTRYARGSGAKLAKADAAFYVEAIAPFSKVSSGRVRITSTKDRLGEFGRNAVWDVDVSTGDRIRLSFGHLSPDEAAALVQRAARGPNPARDAALRTQLVSFLRRNPGASSRALRDSKIAGKDALERVLGQMQEAGELRIEGDGKAGAAKRHHLAEDPLLPTPDDEGVEGQ